MSLADIVSFRRDLLFNGAVQLGWLETERPMAELAAQHFAFHGPQYHGVTRGVFEADGHQLVDTASFTLDLLERITGRRPDEPFALAVAGYGTGKSHLAVTLASLLGAPASPLAHRILENLHSADQPAGEAVQGILRGVKRPFLVVALNGMKNFDLTAEVVRQVIFSLRERGLDTSPVEELRPRFRYAASFTESVFDAFEAEFQREFDGVCRREEILERLRLQDEDAYNRVNAIYERKLGTSIRAAGQESIHDFLRVVRESYCGEDKAFSGLLILFDEFGRYMEFAVQRPLIAGSGALQQLYEAVQANGDGVFLLCFIQYELRAYVSRVAPELRDELERYVSRYDGVRKVRLSTNLETLIANLIEKRSPELLKQQLAHGESSAEIRGYMRRWFPELDNHAVWADPEAFERVIRRGCWPLHPLSTWLLYKLASAGKSLHQRSALSLLADVYERFQDVEAPLGFTLAPADLCSDDLVDEFVSSERSSQQAPSAQAYQAVVSRLEHLLSQDEVRVLKSVLLLTKIGARIPAKEEWAQAIGLFSGCSRGTALNVLHSLEFERGALTWNETLHHYEIVSDGVPRAQFLAYLEAKVGEIPALRRGELFSANFRKWFPEAVSLSTDFGMESEISTREWNYAVSFGNVNLLSSQIELAVLNWREARGVDEPKGRLIYCYVGPESDLASVRVRAETQLRESLTKAGIRWEIGAPIAVSFLHDEDGSFAKRVAEYWLLRSQMDPTDAQRFANFIPDRQNSLEQELQNQFEELRRRRSLAFAAAQEVSDSSLKSTLTRLFAAVYPERIPFPFDGFGVAAGNAARYNQEFTRSLFLGQFDQVWISTRPGQEKHRAHQVLVESWQVLDADGRLRSRPGNAAVRKLIDLMDSWLSSGEGAEPERRFNLGKAFQLLCAPPYGCNLASAGLVLALFFGGRKDTLSLLKKGQPTSPESWLQSALPRYYLELSELNETTVVQVELPDEWQRLLNDWGLETTYSGKVEYLRKGRELENRIPTPMSFFHWYDNLRSKAHDAMSKLAEHERRLNQAIERIERSREGGKLSGLSWGAADLARLSTTMKEEEGCWTKEQIAEVEKRGAEARVMVQEEFSSWLPHQIETSVAHLGDWVREMEHILANLGVLGLVEEQSRLRRHIDKVQAQVQFLDRVQTLASNVESFVNRAVVNRSTPVAVLNELLKKASEFDDELAEARQRNVDLVRADLDSSQALLEEFKNRCLAQAEAHKERLLEAYNWDVKTLTDLHDLRAEIAALKQIFAGEERDLADLVAVGEELDLVETDYRKLDSEALDGEEFERLLERSAEAMQDHFGGEPPLYNDPYEGIGDTIRARRRQVAEEWMRANLPDLGSIERSTAEWVRDLRSGLQNPPRLLSPEERLRVDEAVRACDRRLDRLEVEGLLARFQGVTNDSRRVFLQRVRAEGFIADLCRRAGCSDLDPVQRQPACDLDGCKCPLFQA